MRDGQGSGVLYRKKRAESLPLPAMQEKGQRAREREREGSSRGSTRPRSPIVRVAPLMEASEAVAKDKARLRNRTVQSERNGQGFLAIRGKEEGDPFINLTRVTGKKDASFGLEEEEKTTFCVS